MRGINSRRNIPWLCVGNFNEIIKQDEKLEGDLRSHNQMQNFKDVIDEQFLRFGICGLEIHME